MRIIFLFFFFQHSTSSVKSKSCAVHLKIISLSLYYLLKKLMFCLSPAARPHLDWDSDLVCWKMRFSCMFSRADEENDSSSSEEEEDDKKRLTDELLGQICSIENTEDSTDWFMALVN